MKAIIAIMTLSVLLTACSRSSPNGADTEDVTVRLDSVSPMGTRTNMWFKCSVTVHNSTGASVTATSLFLFPQDLALKISDLDGKELKRLYEDPHINEPTNWVIPTGDSTYTNILYGLVARPSLSLPDGVHTVRVHVEGTLSGSSYTNRLTSNVVEVQVP